MSEKKKATCHPEKDVVAKGLCATCYKAHQRAEAKAKEIESAPLPSPNDDAPTFPTNGDGFADDKAAQLYLERILWKWIAEGEQAVVCYNPDGSRDYKTEVRLRDMRDQKAMKAATILARKLMPEKEKERQPLEELPGQNDLMSFAKGWMAAATSSPTPRQRAQGGLTSPPDDTNDDNVFDA